MTRCASLMLALVASCLSACEQRAVPPADEEVSRVVTLAPHLAELMYAIDAHDLLVGVSIWSDYPAAARQLPVVGDAFAVDHEQLALLKPDLLLAWDSGMPAHVIDELRLAGYRVEVLQTRGTEDVATAMLRLGEMTGRDAEAQAAAQDYNTALAELREAHAAATPLRVFYQVSTRPLYTINAEHFLSDLIAICGGVNIFADLGDLAPAVTDEAVIARDPEVMLAGDKSSDEPFAEWQRWPNIAANRYGNHYTIDSDTSSRPTPRLVTAGEEICRALDKARAKLAH